MSAQPRWFHRLEEILEELRCSSLSHLDRLAVQKLLLVGERRARQIMAGLPGMRVGNAIAIERQALLSRLENTAGGERFQWEITRRARLAEDLERTRRGLAARRVRIEAPAEVWERSLKELGPGVVLLPRELRIEFRGAQELAARLFGLSQAMANDWMAFVAALDDAP